MVITSIPTPYRTPVFNSLAEGHGIDLRVIYLASRDARRAWPSYDLEMRHDYRVLRPYVSMPRRDSFLHISHGLIAELADWRPEVVIAGGWDQPLHLLAFGLRERMEYRFVFWVESNERDTRSGARWIEVAKHLLARKADGIIVPGLASHRYIRSLGTAKDRIFVAPNAVANDFWGTHALCDRRNRSGPARFLYVGRLHPHKGLDVLMDVWREVGPTEASLAIVGEGPLRVQIEKRVKETDGCVQLTGHVDRHELAMEYALADALVLPSRSEPWGLVINEAMAAALPIVASRSVGAAEDLIEEGGNGFVVPPDDPGRLLEAVRALARDPERRLSMGARSHEIVSSFTPDRCAEAFAAAIERLRCPSGRRITGDAQRS